MFSGEDVITREIPDFDLLKLGEVRWLWIGFYRSERDSSSPFADLILSVTYHQSRPERTRRGAKTYFVNMLFREVRQLTLSGLGGFVYQLSELAIENVKDRGMEGINYFVSDDDAHFCYCRDVQFIALSELLEDGSETILWSSDSATRVEVI